MSANDKILPADDVLSKLLKIILDLSYEDREALLKAAENIQSVESDDTQRVSGRKAYSNYVNFFSGDKSYWGLSIDISNGGMFIETSESHELSEVITLNFPNTDQTKIVEIQAKIVRITPKGIGVEFTEG